MYKRKEKRAREEERDIEREREREDKNENKNQFQTATTFKTIINREYIEILYRLTIRFQRRHNILNRRYIFK